MSKLLYNTSIIIDFEILSNIYLCPDEFRCRLSNGSTHLPSLLSCKGLKENQQF